MCFHYLLTLNDINVFNFYFRVVTTSILLFAHDSLANHSIHNTILKIWHSNS